MHLKEHKARPGAGGIASQRPRIPGRQTFYKLQKDYAGDAAAVRAKLMSRLNWYLPLNYDTVTKATGISCSFSFTVFPLKPLFTFKFYQL